MQAPDWFSRFIDMPRHSRRIEVQGTPIHYDTWEGPKNAPSLLFVHGNGAHSHWWDFIAPAFTNDFNVMAMDLSGAGDSGHRDRYSAVTFADEILAVAEDAGHASTTVVGHSFGGSMTRIAGYLYGDRLAGIVLVDSAMSRNRGRRMPPSVPRAGEHYYESLAQAKRRFRLRPPQPCENDFILDYIAGHSVHKTEQGWCFKLDRAMFSKMVVDQDREFPDAATLIEAIPCPVGLIYGAQSRFFDAGSVALAREIIAPELLCCISDAHHHVFLDQPLAFIDTLRQLLTRL